MRKKMIAALILMALAGGCVQRTVTVRSSPPGALVYLNDQEVGRTPVTRKFKWYGTYDVELRLEGYDAVKTTAKVWAPWWQIVPLDLVTEALPLTDNHELNFTLHPPSEMEEEPELMVKRGQQLAKELESSQRAQTQPTTKPHRAKPTTQPSGKE
ncbi:MAG: hypothetical protein JWL69_4737 [Phycisphaerales bacterium]|nr:hypothetical protein [Phycisphaerales bacterium]MDB5356704.1 hypothetical protein [Phycisphaerales bacterium]